MFRSFWPLGIFLLKDEIVAKSAQGWPDMTKYRSDVNHQCHRTMSKYYTKLKFMLTKYWSVLYFNAGYFATQFDLLWKLNLICYISIYFPIKAFITFVSFIVSDLFHEISQTLRVLFLNYLRTHIVWKSLKMSHLNFLIFAFFINFCPVKIDISGNTPCPQSSGFQKVAKMTIF